MARTVKGCVYRPVVTGRKGGTRTRRRSRLYWCKYRGPDGKYVHKALKLPDGQGVTDKEVAETTFRSLVTRMEREAAGLTDSFAEAARTPIRVILARFLRHLRHRRCGRQYIKQVLSNIKHVIDKANMRRLTDFNENRIDRALGMIADRGRSARTVNIYRNVCHAMGEWCVQIARVLNRNPVTAVPLRSCAVDTRKVRRALTVDEARKLLSVSGVRKLFYQTQMMTGLRVREVRQLQWRDLHLDGERLYIKLRAKTTKAKRADEIDLNKEFAAELAAAKPPSASTVESVFGGTPTLRTFKRDLKRAGIPFSDDCGRTVDRHALRTTFVSWLGQRGVDPRVAQLLARHSDIRLTTKTYQDPRLLDARAAVDKLPNLRQDAAAKEDAKPTVNGSGEKPVALCVAPTTDTDRPRPSSDGLKEDLTSEQRGSSKSSRRGRLGTKRHRLSSDGKIGLTVARLNRPCEAGSTSSASQRHIYRFFKRLHTGVRDRQRLARRW